MHVELGKGLDCLPLLSGAVVKLMEVRNKLIKTSITYHRGRPIKAQISQE